MKTVNKRRFAKLPALLSAVALSALIASCTSSDPEGEDNMDNSADTNGDGVVDILDGDYNGDGMVDLADEDFNGDGFVDVGEADMYDINGDGFIDNDDDTNGDGVINGDDASDAIPSGPCAQEGGSDPSSSDQPWNNNCTIKRFGVYADSQYSRGIQRVVFCQGHGGAGATFSSFDDGEFGPGTESAVEAFQAAEGLTVDGVVGAETWAALQNKLEYLSSTAGGDDWGVSSVACDQQIMFYSTNGDPYWSMAASPDSANTIPFDITSPF